MQVASAAVKVLFTLRAYLPRANVNLAHRHLTATGHIGVKIRSDERDRQRQQAGLWLVLHLAPVFRFHL